MKVVLVTQSCLTLCDPMDGGSARLLCPRDSPGKNTGVGSCSLLQRLFPNLRDQIQVSCIAGRFFTVWATKEYNNLQILASENYEKPGNRN